MEKLLGRGWTRPTVFCQNALQNILTIVNKCSTSEDLLLANADTPLLVDKKNRKCRHPDVSIWEPRRLELDEDGEVDCLAKSIDGIPEENAMNPHVIIEFSWTKYIDTEIEKLKLHVTDNIGDHGVVKVGFLIKAMTTAGERKYPTFPGRSVPL
jgi:hypothetical protein